MIPAEPELAPEAETTTVDLPDLRRLYRGIQILVVIVVLYGLLFGLFGLEMRSQNADQDTTDEHLLTTDDELEQTADELAALVVAEAHEEELEQASTCVSSHVRFGGLKELLRRIGERTNMTDDEVAGLLDGYPPPSCDLRAAQDVLAAG